MSANNGRVSTYTSCIMHQSIRLYSSASKDNHSSTVIFDVKSEDEFDQLVLKSKTPVLVDFHAEYVTYSETYELF